MDKPSCSFRNETLKFFRTFHIRKSFFVLLLLRSPFDFLLNFYYANMLRSSFDCIEAKSEHELLVVFIKFLVGTALLFLYNGTVWSIYAAYTVKIHSGIRKTVFGKIIGLPYQSLAKSPAGAWVTLGNTDVQTADTFLNGNFNLPHLAVSFINVIFSSVALILADIRFFLLSAAFIVPQVLLSNSKFAKPMTNLKKRTLDETAKFTSMLEPAITSAEVIQIYDAGDYLYGKLNESSLRMKEVNMEICRKKALNACLTPLFSLPGYALLLFMGGIFEAGNVMTFGSLTYILQYRASCLSGCNMFVNCNINMRTNLAGVKRLNDLMERK